MALNQSFSPSGPRSGFWKFAAGFLAIVAVAIGLFLLISYFSPEARRDRELQKNYEQAQRALSEFEERMRADTYGGKTPQETLNLFVEALRTGDVELASKYFALDTKNSRDEWRKGLEKAKEEGRLSEMAVTLTTAQPYLQDRAYENDFKFAVWGETGGDIKVYINMEFNKFSGVWKIESL